MNHDNLTTALSLTGGQSENSPRVSAGITGGLFDLPEGVKAVKPVLTDEDILSLWNEVTEGQPESRRNVWLRLFNRNDGSAEALEARFDHLRQSGRIKGKGRYRFGDDKYIVVPSTTPAPPTKANTCADCKHFSRCSWLLGRQGDEKDCDWTPSRFVLAIPVVQKSGAFVHDAPEGHTFSWENDKPCTYPCRECGGELRSRWYTHPTNGLLGLHECVACPWWHTI